MEAMRESWTDDRLDHLSARMDERFDAADARMDARFDAVDARFEAMDARMDGSFAEIDRRLRGVEGELQTQRTEFRAAIDRIDGRLDGLQRSLIQMGGAMMAAFGAAIIGLIATQL